MGSTDQSESQALVSEGSRERGRGQGRGHHRGTGKGRWRSQARGRTVRCFYCDQEGHIKRDCPKYKAQNQSSDTAATTVMADEDEIDVLLAASDDGKSDWVLDSGSAYHLCRDRERSVGSAWQTGGLVTLTEWRNSQSFQGKQRRCCGERRLEGYTDWRGVSRQELLSDMGPVVLARRMDKGSNRCTEVRKASAGVLRGSVMVPGGPGVVQERRDMLWDICAHKGGEMESTTTRKVTYFTAHTSGRCGAPWWGGTEHIGEKSYGGAGSEVVKKDNLKTSDYPQWAGGGDSWCWESLSRHILRRTGVPYTVALLVLGIGLPSLGVGYGNGRKLGQGLTGRGECGAWRRWLGRGRAGEEEGGAGNKEEKMKEGECLKNSLRSYSLSI
ncbi:hypothetical protein Acr_07g0011130 [Actinidia rufa]|uniref:CCHC-type domain-containing protein n=1 Tax=Actinidia rufa TaxID=165716 RepID=A0A7J0EZ55_9ERIC|nr:hypothetical protein Acr_07g0011130 [Actinidia rufa]